MVWSHNVVLEFLELYKSEEILWNPKHNLRRDKVELDNAWLRIKSNLSIDCTVTELKKKKESLMSAFRFHLHRKMKSPNTYIINWYAYPLMESFLSEKYNNYETTTVANKDHEYFNNTMLLEPNQDKERLFISSEQITSTDNVKNNVTPSISRPQISVVKLLNPNSEPSCTTSTSTEELDECDLYCQLLAKKLKKMDENHRDVAMHEIDNIMFCVKTGHPIQSQFQRPSYSKSPSPTPKEAKPSMFIVTQTNVNEFDVANIQYQQHT